MRFKTIPLIRYYAGISSIVIFFILPSILLLLSVFSTSIAAEDRLLFVIFTGVLFFASTVLLYTAHLEKCFACLTITDDMIILKCPFRKTVTIQRKECMCVGLVFEDTPIPFEYPYICFSSFPNTEQDNVGKGRIKSKDGWIVFRYTPELGEYVVKEFSKITSYSLCNYHRKHDT